MSRVKVLLGFASFFLLIFFSIAPRVSATETRHVHKRALIIAISKYSTFHDNSRLVRDLDCDADSKVVSDILKDKFRFSDSDITVLSKPETTTKASIEGAFEKLIASTNPGDVVYVHYSGHGSQIPDETNRKGNGQADTICPSDLNIDDASHQFNMILDKQLANYVQQISSREPMLAMLMFDCCHSGMVTRGTGITRGFASPARALLTHGNVPEPAIATTDLIRSPSKNVLVMAACRPDEEANEFHNQMGLFTHAFAEVMKDYKGEPDYTFQDLANDVNVAVANAKAPDQRSQHLMMDGPTTNALLSDRKVPIENKITATVVKQNELWLNEGSLGGITTGSKFAIYPKYAKNFLRETPLAHGQVSDMVTATKAKLSLTDGDISKLQVGQTTATVETEHCYQNPMRISLRNISGELADSLERALVGAKSSGIIIERADTPTAVRDWSIELSIDSQQRLVAITDDERQLCSVDVSGRHGESQLSEIKNCIHRESLWRMLKELKNNSKLNVALKIIPIDADHIDLPAKASDYGRMKFKAGDRFRIELTNASDRDLYVTVFDVEPTGLVEPIYPSASDSNSANIKIGKGQSWRVPAWCTVDDKGFGNDIIKVVATIGPADFSPIFSQTRSFERVGNPLVQLFRDANEGTRSVRSEEIPQEDWATASQEIVTIAN